MQHINVIDSSTSDYLHDDEIVELHHLAAGKRYNILFKNLDGIGTADGTVGLYMPTSLIAHLAIEGDYCVVVLSDSPDAAAAAARKTAIEQMVRSNQESS